MKKVVEPLFASQSELGDLIEQVTIHNKNPDSVRDELRQTASRVAKILRRVDEEHVEEYIDATILESAKHMVDDARAIASGKMPILDQNYDSQNYDAAA
jgi:hypothetical protein